MDVRRQGDAAAGGQHLVAVGEEPDPAPALGESFADLHGARAGRPGGQDGPRRQAPAGTDQRLPGSGPRLGVRLEQQDLGRARRWPSPAAAGPA